MKRWLVSEVKRAPAAWALALVVLAAAASYANSLRGGFHYDDLHHIVGNPYLRDAKYAQQYLHRPDMFSALPGHNMYRPAVLWSFHLNYSTGGYDPLHWRLTAIALHTIAAVGVFLTFLALMGRFAPGRPRIPGALVAALFFAVHPVFSETVNYASARSSLLATGCLLWAFWAHLKAGETGRRRATGVLLHLASLAWFTLALLSKEIAIVFPALLFWTAVLSRRGYLAVLPAFAVALVFLYVRKTVLGTAVIDFAAREAARAAADHGSGGARPILWNLYTQARVICWYLFLLVAPVGLCIHRYVRVSETPFEVGVIGGGALIVALLVVAWRQRRERPLLSLGIVWFFTSLAPTSSIIPLNQVMNEHRMYLPGAGIAFALGSIWRSPARSYARWAVPVAALALMAFTIRRNHDWADPVRLWESAVAASPKSDGAWNSLGAQLRRAGRDDRAEDAFRAALKLNPQSWDATFNMGTLALARGRRSKADRDLEEARRWLERSLALRPGATRSRWFLAEVDFRAGRLDRAENAFAEMAGLTPRLHEMTRFALAKIALKRRQYDRARAYYEEALASGTDPVAARLGLGTIALEKGDRRAAEQAARQAMASRPHSAAPYMFLARMAPGTPRAIRCLFEAERRGYRPSAEERRSILGERRS